MRGNEPLSPLGQQHRLDAILRQMRADLPLRYWNQIAHYVAPASNGRKVRLAIEEGTRPTAELLRQVGVSADELADRLEIPASSVHHILEAPLRAPAIVLDGEDAVAPGPEMMRQALDVASDALARANWGSDPGTGTLRCYRIPRLVTADAHDHLVALLDRLAGAGGSRGYPLDALVYPKAEISEELDWLMETLSVSERRLGVPEGRIRIVILVESALGFERIHELVRHVMPRLCALVAGLVDYSADIGVRMPDGNHPVADWARFLVTNAAAAAGVPALDGMTTAFPVVGPGSISGERRDRFLDRVALVYGDARHAFELGMTGKWVGHPVQLTATLLAWEALLSGDVLKTSVSIVRSYADAVARGVGVVTVEGQMIDAATDRGARTLLRRATATGLFPADQARDLGVIGLHEVVVLPSQYSLDPPGTDQG